MKRIIYAITLMVLLPFMAQAQEHIAVAVTLTASQQQTMLEAHGADWSVWLHEQLRQATRNHLSTARERIRINRAKLIESDEMEKEEKEVILDKLDEVKAREEAKRKATEDSLRDAEVIEPPTKGYLTPVYPWTYETAAMRGVLRKEDTVKVSVALTPRQYDNLVRRYVRVNGLPMDHVDGWVMRQDLRKLEQLLVGKSNASLITIEDPEVSKPPNAWGKAAHAIGLYDVPNWVPWAVWGMAVVGTMAVIAWVLR